MSSLDPLTYLDLVQRTSIECAVPGTGPDTVAGASGQVLDFCQYVANAWMELQTMHDDWSFMLVSPGVSFVTVAAQSLYTPTQAGVSAGEVSSWKRGTFRNYLTATGTPSEVRMQWIDYDEWRDCYQIGTLRTTQVQPMMFSITPELSLVVQCPLAGYTITADYYSAPVRLSGNSDTPSIPRRFNMAIVYRAMMDYGVFESDPEIYQKGKRGYDLLVGRLEKQRLPSIGAGGALA